MTEIRHRPAGPSAGSITTRSGGIGRSTSAEAERVSDDLRRHTGSFLGERRSITALSLVASAAMGAVLSYQAGIVRHLPEPPSSFLDADRVDASGEAYQMLKTPDAAIGLASYAITTILATAGTSDRWRQRPWLPLALVAKVGVDAISGVYLTVEQASKHRRFCSWCLVGAAASVAMVPRAVPEGAAALRHLRGADGR